MLDTDNRQLLVRIVSFSFIASLFIPLVAIFYSFIIYKDIPSNIKGIVLLYKTNNLHWFVLSSIIIIPLISYLVSTILIKRLAKAQELSNFSQQQIKKAFEFTKSLINEDFSAEYSLSDTDDRLGSLLIELRDTLKNNKDIDQKRRKDDEIRHWHAEGLAKFGDILRNDNDKLEILSFNIIKALTKYIDAVQGGFYMLHDEDESKPYFDLTAFFAYDRKKFAEQKISWGDGLIGTCARERKTIYMTKVPDNYVNVTSGLGSANPRSILLIPLIYEDNLQGVIEFASLKTYEKHEIEFAEKVAENIAATFTTVKMNLKTSKLLEDTKEQAQTLTSQEEEMRQNMEELQATQEEAARQTEQFIALENTINENFIRAEYELNGNLISANKLFLQKFEYGSHNLLTNANVFNFIPEEDTGAFNKIWEAISLRGEHYQKFMPHRKKSGKELYLSVSYSPMKRSDGTFDKVQFMAIDASDSKSMELTLNGLNSAITQAGVKLDLDLNGNILNCNPEFLEIVKYSKSELSSLTIVDLLDPIEIELFNKSWEKIIEGTNFKGTFKLKSKDRSEKWIQGVFNAISEVSGDIKSAVFVGHDATSEKVLELENHQKQDLIDEKSQQLKKIEKEFGTILRETRNELTAKFNEVEKVKLINERTLENIADAVISTTHDNKISYFNPAAEKLLGYSKDDVLKHDIGMLFSDSAIEENAFISKYVGPGNDKVTGKREKVQIKHKSGKEIHVNIMLSKAEVENFNTYTAFIQNL